MISTNQLNQSMTGTPDEIQFKSTHKNWCFEFSDIKNNTVRVVDESDRRFQMLKTYAGRKLEYGELLIKVRCVETGDVFCRAVRHVAFYGRFCDITWYEGDF